MLQRHLFIAQYGNRRFKAFPFARGLETSVSQRTALFRNDLFWIFNMIVGGCCTVPCKGRSCFAWRKCQRSASQHWKMNSYPFKFAAEASRSCCTPSVSFGWTGGRAPMVQRHLFVHSHSHRSHSSTRSLQKTERVKPQCEKRITHERDSHCTTARSSSQTLLCGISASRGAVLLLCDYIRVEGKGNSVEERIRTQS